MVTFMFFFQCQTIFYTVHNTHSEEFDCVIVDSYLNLPQYFFVCSVENPNLG